MIYVDVPVVSENPEKQFDDGWKGVKTFRTRAEAIAFAHEMWGADEQGNVCLIVDAGEEPERKEAGV